MPKKTQTPAEVLNKLMEEYKLNPFSLSKAININQTTARLLALGEANVTVPIALRLSKFFGQTPFFWLDLQQTNDLAKALNDKKLTKILKGIPKAQKPKLSAKPKPTGKTVKRKTLSEKRKQAAKIPGARPAKRKRS